MSDASGALAYQFAGFRLDLRKRLLFSADSQPVPLSPRAFETLAVLVEQAGELLDKSDLMRKVATERASPPGGSLRTALQAAKIPGHRAGCLRPKAWRHESGAPTAAPTHRPLGLSRSGHLVVVRS